MELLRNIYILIVVGCSSRYCFRPSSFLIMDDDIKTADPNNALVKFADDLTLGVPAWQRKW